MQSLKKKYPKGSDEANAVLKVTREEGRGAGQEMVGCTYIPFINLLEYLTGNRNFGLCSTRTQTRSVCEVLDTKAHSALSKWISSLDARIEAEKRGLEAERELKLLLLEYYEAKKTEPEPTFKLCGVRE